MKIICNTPGKGREKNPHSSEDWGGDPYNAFNNKHPELSAFHSDHTTPLPIGEWDVELVWQYRMPNEATWTSDLNYDAYRRGFQVWYDEMKGIADFETRQIYLSTLPPAQPVKAVEEEIKVQLTFRHPNGSELVSAPYTIEQLLEKSEDEIQEATCDCDCKPTGESSYKDCNCADYYEKFVLVKSSLYSPHPIETPAIATSEVQRVIGDTSFVHLTDGWVQIVTKNGAVDLAPEELTELTSFILTTHVPVDEVEKIKSVLKQIRRVELLTPETEALINKILNP